MQSIQNNLLQSLRAVEQFIDDNATQIPGVVNTGMRQRLTDVIAALEIHKSDQAGHGIAAVNSGKQQYALRKELLRDYMAPIARIARADIPQAPNIQGFRMPQGVPGVEKVTALADGMAKAAAPYVDIFVNAGLPADFITQLQHAAALLINIRTKRTTTTASRVGATKSLKASLTTGRKVVHVLDAFMQTALKDDLTLRSNWNAVKRVHRIGARTASVAPVPTPVPAPVQTSVPAPEQTSVQTPVQASAVPSVRVEAAA